MTLNFPDRDSSTFAPLPKETVDSISVIEKARNEEKEEEKENKTKIENPVRWQHILRQLSH